MAFTNYKMLSIRLLILLSLISSFSATTCDFDVTLEQELSHLGFHRNISYKVMLRDTYGDSLQYEECYIGLNQMLPKGVFTSPDELGDLRRMNKLMAIPKNKVNIELPAEDAQPTSVYIISQVNNGEVNLWLPVHARYHRAAKGGGSYSNKIEAPRLFIRCPHLELAQCNPQTAIIKFLCNGTGKEMCIWKEINASLLTNPTTLFTVPIGNIDDNNIVVPVTIGTVVIMSLYLLKSLHDYKLGLLRKKE